MPRRLLTITFVLGSIGAWGCTPEKKEHVAQTGVEEGKALKAENAKTAATPEIMPNTHVAAGKMLERQGDFNGAIVQYEKAIASEPRCTTAYNRLGIVYQKIGRYADAENIFKQGASADLTSAALLNNLGYCYLVQKKLPEAEQAFRDALDRSQDFLRARMNLAIVLAQSGRLDESLIEFSHVVPADAAHYNLAMICLQRRDYANAEKSLRDALKINPACAGARDQLRRVGQLAASTAKESSSPDVTPAGPLAGNAEDNSNAVAP